MGGDTDPNAPWDDGIVIWSLKDPVHPMRLGQWKTGGLGTHRNGYFGGRYVHTAAAVRGYFGQIYVIVDIEYPRFGLINVRGADRVLVELRESLK